MYIWCKLFTGFVFTQDSWPELPYHNTYFYLYELQSLNFCWWYCHSWDVIIRSFCRHKSRNWFNSCFLHCSVGNQYKNTWNRMWKDLKSCRTRTVYRVTNVYECLIYKITCFSPIMIHFLSSLFLAVFVF